MKARLGLLGGMFDPVHIGHIKVALHAIEYLQLDQLKIIPCSVPNHRAPAVASSEHRLNMLELVTEKYSTISILSFPEIIADNLNPIFFLYKQIILLLRSMARPIS